MTIPSDVFRINEKHNISEQVLKLAGWHPERRVEVKESHLAKFQQFGYQLSTKQEDILHEFWDLEEIWFFRWADKDNKVHIGGYQFIFEIMSFFNDEKGSKLEDIEYELAQIPTELQSKVVPLINVGFHLPSKLWVHEDGRVFLTSAFKQHMREYSSVLEMLNDQLAFDSNYIYVSFAGTAVLHWDDLAK